MARHLIYLEGLYILGDHKFGVIVSRGLCPGEIWVHSLSHPKNNFSWITIHANPINELYIILPNPPDVMCFMSFWVSLVRGLSDTNKITDMVRCVFACFPGPFLVRRTSWRVCTCCWKAANLEEFRTFLISITSDSYLSLSSTVVLLSSSTPYINI